MSHAIYFHRLGTSFFRSPRLQIRVPFVRIRNIRRYNTNVISLYIRCEQNMESRSSQYKIAGQVFVFRVRLNHLIRIYGREDIISRYVSTSKAHIHMIRPIEFSFPDTSPDKLKRIVGYLSHICIVSPSFQTYSSIRFALNEQLDSGPKSKTGLKRHFRTISCGQLLDKMNTEAIDFRAASECFSSIRNLRQSNLRTLQITTIHQNYEVPTVGGFLLFGRDRREAFPDAYIRAGCFGGIDKSNIIDSPEIVGYLPLA